MLAPGPSCAPPAPQLTREWSRLASIGPSQRGLLRHLNYIVRAIIFEFESYMPVAVSKRSCLRLPTWQTILDVISHLLTSRCQLEKLLLDERVFGRFGKFPIVGRLV